MPPLFRKATRDDLDAIAAIYERTHDEEEAGHTTIGWVRNIYPTHATAEAALSRNDLFVAENNGHIVGAAIINHLQGTEYADAPWTISVPDEAIMVLHTLVIDPAVKSHGLGSAFVAFYEQYAKANGCQALRMDTNARNRPARTLYNKLGYQEIATVPCQFNGIDGVELVLLEKKID
ncbi:MAG: GNAT family N-acetyltransferase [Peptococcaceae bacterium]|nr:GNAT family N-acetyltransferase [Peptococcaceae bacterium]